MSADQPTAECLAENGRDFLDEFVERGADAVRDAEKIDLDEDDDAPDGGGLTPRAPVLDDAAFHGLAGEIVRSLDPYTEADPAAVLVHLLAGFGSLVGPGPYFPVGPERHPARLFAVVVGATGVGRKGTAWSTARLVLHEADPDWSTRRCKSGLSTGEGVVHDLRDPRVERKPAGKGGRAVDGEGTVVDPGEADKRLFLVEPEFGRVLGAMRRDGNTLSPVLRQAWDSGRLNVLTKNAPCTATGVHLAVVGHVTVEEFRELSSAVDRHNGFLNRFLWCHARRSKTLPLAPPVPDALVADFGRRLASAAATARKFGPVRFDPEAERIWVDGLYARLTRDRRGQAAPLFARSAPYVLRLSLIYALLDGSTVVRDEHLMAAVMVWEYSERSAAIVFAGPTADPTAKRILDALRDRPAGLSRTEISKLFQGNKPKAALDAALEILDDYGLAERADVPTDGRSKEVWTAVRRVPRNDLS
ncbi:MAG: DUF3987 domain-containing protein [Planctomycetia bacterium]